MYSILFSTLTSAKNSSCKSSLFIQLFTHILLKVCGGAVIISNHLTGVSFWLSLCERRRPGWDSQVALEAACGRGCNPHCHFLLLLQSISFDHSVLLDFLISSETCFLHYLVRYLRFLFNDSQGFAAACRRIDSADHRFPERCSAAAAEAAKAAHRVGVERSAEKFRLVEYPSSDESDQDEADCQGQSEVLKVPGSVNEHVQRFPPGEEPPCPSSKRTDGKTWSRTVDCLSQLRLVVSRLQARKLFPYNPSSLLKLLARVGHCSPPMNE